MICASFLLRISITAWVKLLEKQDPFELMTMEDAAFFRQVQKGVQDSGDTAAHDALLELARKYRDMAGENKQRQSANRLLFLISLFGAILAAVFYIIVLVNP